MRVSLADKVGNTHEQTIAPAFLVGDDTGIGEVVETDYSTAEYFNMQGVRVLNPGEGFYIVRRGGKVTKEIIRH